MCLFRLQTIVVVYDISKELIRELRLNPRAISITSDPQVGSGKSLKGKLSEPSNLVEVEPRSIWRGKWT